MLIFDVMSDDQASVLDLGGSLFSSSAFRKARKGEEKLERLRETKNKKEQEDKPGEKAKKEKREEKAKIDSRRVW